MRWHAFTSGSAYVNHDDATAGRWRWERADLAVLDRNIFDVDAGHVGDATVRAANRERQGRARPARRAGTQLTTTAVVVLASRA